MQFIYLFIHCFLNFHSFTHPFIPSFTASLILRNFVSVRCKNLKQNQEQKITLAETFASSLKIDGWKMNFLIRLQGRSPLGPGKVTLGPREGHPWAQTLPQGATEGQSANLPQLKTNRMAVWLESPYHRCIFT